jgi:hypothetical protein
MSLEADDLDEFAPRVAYPTPEGIGEKCGVVGAVQAHHADYARPLDVSWLCISCHRDIHRIGATDGE